MSKLVSRTGIVILVMVILCGGSFVSGFYAGKVMAPPPTTITTTGSAHVGGLVSTGDVNASRVITSSISGATLLGDISLAGNDIVGGTWLNGTNAGLTNAYLASLTNGRVVLVGADGKIIDDAGLIFDPATNALTVAGTVTGANFTTTGWTNTTDLKFTDDFFWGTENRTDTLAYPEQVASYIVFKSGPSLTYTSAKNGATGQIDWNSTDAATVIQAAINALPNGGGIFVKAGSYYITTPISITKALTIIGEGFDISGAATTLFKTNATITDVLHIASSGDRPVFMSNFGIDGNGKQSAGITIIYTVSSRFSDISIIDCTKGLNILSASKTIFTNIRCLNNDYGLYLYDAAGPIISSEVVFLMCYFGDSTLYGVYDAYTFGVATTKMHFISCTIESNHKYGMYLPHMSDCAVDLCLFEANNKDVSASQDDLYFGAVQNIAITNCIFIGTDVRFSIFLESNKKATLYNNRVGDRTAISHVSELSLSSSYFSGNLELSDVDNAVITSTEIAGQAYTDASCSNVVFIGMNFSGTKSFAGTTMRWINNAGYITENGGTFSIALHSSTATITHNLSYTPAATDITITWTTVGGLLNCTSWSVTGITSTQFVVNLYDSTGAAKGPSGTVTGSWAVRKTP
jgi:hypothetical protein